MKTYVWLSFAFMGWAYYEMSGGSDFVPEQRSETIVAEMAAPAPTVEVTRADTTSLLTVAPNIEEPQVVLASVETTSTNDATAETITQAVESPEMESLVIGAEAPPIVDLRAIAGARVNMRQGPGTNYGVIVTLPQGTEVEVLEVDANGWARLIVPSTGQEGWMAERLLTDPA